MVVFSVIAVWSFMFVEVFTGFSVGDVMKFYIMAFMSVPEVMPI